MRIDENARVLSTWTVYWWWCYFQNDATLCCSNDKIKSQSSDGESQKIHSRRRCDDVTSSVLIFMNEHWSVQEQHHLFSFKNSIFRPKRFQMKMGWRKLRRFIKKKTAFGCTSVHTKWFSCCHYYYYCCCCLLCTFVCLCVCVLIISENKRDREIVKLCCWCFFAFLLLLLFFFSLDS